MSLIKLRVLYKQEEANLCLFLSLCATAIVSKKSNKWVKKTVWDRAPFLAHGTD